MVMFNVSDCVCKLSRCYNYDDNSTQGLIRTHINLSLAKTQGSLSSATI